MIVWCAQPTTSKADEVADQYRAIMHQASLPIMVIRGRLAEDPHGKVGEKMCPRHATIGKLALIGIAIQQVICKTCPLRGSCGYIRQEREIAALGNRAFFVLSREYLFVRCPAPAPDLIVADEAVTMIAIEEIHLPVASNEQIPLWLGIDDDLSEAASAAVRTLTKLLTALRGPRPLAALRDSGVAAADLKCASSIITRGIEYCKISINGFMSDQEINSAIDMMKGYEALKVRELIAAIALEIDLGRDTLTGVVLHSRNEKRSEWVTIHRLRPTISVPPYASILVMDGTGSRGLNEAVFPNIEHIHISVPRDADITGTLGRNYSRQSLSGQNRSETGTSSLVESSARMRKEIIAIAERSPGPALIVSNKSVAEKIRQTVGRGDQVRCAHFGAVRGLNIWEDCQSVLVAGRESPSIDMVENRARAYMARDSAPFVSMAIAPPPDWLWPYWPYRATRGRRMADGSVTAVEVEVHPDPRVQEVLEQIREAEIVQAADRVRPIFNRRTITLMNNLALDVTYDRILRHADLAAGGSRWDRAWAATGIVPLGASDLHKAHPGLFPSVEAARLALKREPPNWGQGSNSNSIWAPTPIIPRLPQNPKESLANRIENYSASIHDPARLPRQRITTGPDRTGPRRVGRP
ncbi:MAG: hypothetical protein EXR07_02060, partial [Acetobacteraceae bacterium]|nr:hypothetical protein [Acetobacteraceae bacterium]